MLISLNLNNIFIYDNEVDFDLTADKRTKRFLTNTAEVNGFRVIKSAVILGPNNSGKTNLVKCIKVVRDIILDNSQYSIESNMFSDNPVCHIDVTFDYNDKVYGLEIKYDTSKRVFGFEEYYCISINGKKSSLLRHSSSESGGTVISDRKFFGKEDADIEKAVAFSSHERLIINILNTEKFTTIKKLKDIYCDFASTIDIIDMNTPSITKTIEMMKSSSENQQKIANFIKCADLSLDDYKYLNDAELKISFSAIDDKIIEARIPEKLKSAITEPLHLCSIYKGKPVPSTLFDSIGTQKMAALASYVINALEDGRILVIDEIDSSLHFKLIRSIFSLFNNELNAHGQLICTAHDISLLDCKRMFRKEQIWFACKDTDGVYLYPLSEFTSDNDGIRETSDLVEKYKQGVFGALPSPDMFDVLYASCGLKISDNQEVNGNE